MAESCLQVVGLQEPPRKTSYDDVEDFCVLNFDEVDAEDETLSPPAFVIVDSALLQQRPPPAPPSVFELTIFSSRTSEEREFRIVSLLTLFSTVIKPVNDERLLSWMK